MLAKRTRPRHRIGDLTFNLGQPCLRLAAREGQSLCLYPIQQTGSILDQGHPRDRQLFEFTFILVVRPVRYQIKRRTHRGQNARVNGICFGTRSMRLGKAAGL